jgi:hypothetical protein
MTPDSATLEAELRKLQAATLDDDFFNRLEAATSDSLTILNPEEIRFEAFLRQTRPAALSADYLAKLETVVSTTPFAVNDKILLFPVTSPQAVTPRKQASAWRAVAAVAVIGAFSALMIPLGKKTGTADTFQETVSHPTSGNFIPASFDRNISTVKNEGMVWNSNQQAQSVIRVEYKDKIIYKDSMNRTFQIEQPRVQYLSIPAKTD